MKTKKKDKKTKKKDKKTKKKDNKTIQKYNLLRNIRNKKNSKNSKKGKIIKENMSMKGGKKIKTCMCVDYDEKDNKTIDFNLIKKCERTVVEGTDFCDKHQNCMSFIQKFLNGYELPYQPDLWNNNKHIKNSHNCYTYFLDNQIKPLIHKCKKYESKNKEDKCGDLKPQPGDFYQLVNNGTLKNKNRDYTCESMVKKVLEDNPSIKKTQYNSKCPKGSYKGALVVDRNNTYHFYRQNADGKWSHKPGVLKVTDIDASDNPIYFPHLADRNYKKNKDSGINYNDFCNYLCVPRKDQVKIYAI